jgi:lipopolysaccharide export LptBFGC system permease protein LptF
MHYLLRQIDRYFLLSFLGILFICLFVYLFIYLFTAILCLFETKILSSRESNEVWFSVSVKEMYHF